MSMCSFGLLFILVIFRFVHSDSLFVKQDLSVINFVSQQQSQLLLLQQDPNEKKFPTSEYLALQDLYLSTGGEHWTYRNLSSELPYWNFTGVHNPCIEKWQGVNCTCTESMCNVKTLFLVNFNMTGTIPPTVSNLTLLTSLIFTKNNLYGSIPDTLSSFVGLRRLILSQNYLSGCLPDSLFDLQDLTFLDLSSNYIQDTLSDQIGRLTFLSVLLFNDNLLYGTIPSALGTLKSLTILELSTNRLEGPINSDLQTCVYLAILALAENGLTGEIPAFIGYSFPRLTLLQLDENLLHGTIPRNIGNSTRLVQLSLSDNQLTGSLPVEIGNCVRLKMLSVFENSLWGSLPSSLTRLQQVVYLQLYTNHFTGDVPQGIYNMKHLEYLQINGNSLSQQLPNEILTLSFLVIVDVSNNRLTGKIDTNIFNRRNPEHNSSLQYLLLYNNELSGSVPASISQLQSLKYLDVSSNRLTHTIPSLHGLRDLIFLDLKMNYLQGTVPDALCSLLKLYLFDVHSNLLSGPLPIEINDLTHLQNLFLHDNILSGGLKTFINSTNQQSVINIDISNNQFTGPLPSEPFRIASLATFAAASNCLSGSLPVEICGANALTDLVLDGHKTASSCRRKIFPLISSFETYTLSNMQDNTAIPTCVFTLASLQTLHLSGNSLTGSLSPNIQVAPTLTDLSISHNMIKGRLPEVFSSAGWSLEDGVPRKVFENLDLSYNKLGGLLPASFPAMTSNQTLSLQVNRFSGRMPPALHNAQHISILDGNMFSCGGTNSGGAALGTDSGGSRGAEEELPSHDPFYHIYECGSNTFNQSLYVWLLLFVVVLIAMVTILCAVQCKRHWYDQSRIQSSFSVDNSASRQFDVTTGYHPNTSLLNWLYNKEVSRRLYMAVYIPKSGVDITSWSGSNSSLMSPVSNTNIHFTNSGATSNPCSRLDTSAIIEFGSILSNIRRYAMCLGLLVLGILFPLYALLTASFSSYQVEYAYFFSGAFMTGETPGVVLFTVWSLFLLLVMVLYDRYIYPVFFVLKRGGGTDGATYINGMLTTFTATTNNTGKYTKQGEKRSHARYYTFVSLLVIANCIVVLGINALYVYITLNYDKSIVTGTQVCLALFKLFWNSAVVFDFFAYLKRIYFAAEYEDTDGQQEEGLTNTVSILSITSNATFRRVESRDVLVQSFLVMFNNIASPCLAIAAISSSCFYNAVFLPPSVDSQYSFQFCSSVLISDGSCLEYVTETHHTSYMPPFIYSYQCSSIFITSYSSVYVYLFLITSFGLPLAILAVKGLHSRYAVKDMDLLSFKLLDMLLPEVARPLEEELPCDYKPLVQIDKLCVVMISSIGILITFGALFPPLAAVIVVSVLLTTYTVQLAVGKLLTESQKANYIHYTMRLNEECDGMQSAFRHVVYLLLVFAASFYAFFVYDMLGDEVGWLRAIWAPVCLAMMPLVLYLCIVVGRVLYEAIRKDREEHRGGYEVKYQPVDNAILTTSGDEKTSALNTQRSPHTTNKNIDVKRSVSFSDKSVTFQSFESSPLPVLITRSNKPSSSSSS